MTTFKGYGMITTSSLRIVLRCLRFTVDGVVFEKLRSSSDRRQHHLSIRNFLLAHDIGVVVVVLCCFSDRNAGSVMNITCKMKKSFLLVIWSL